MQRIRKQLISNYVAVALFTVLLLESMFMVVITQYYLGGVERVLVNHAETAANFFNRYADAGDIYTKSNYIFENIDIEEKALVEVLDLNGRVVIDSTGSSTGEMVTTGDFIQALSGHMGTWRGRSEMDELITAVSAPIYDDNNIVGVLRYVSSLEPTYKVIIQYMMVTALVGVVVICVAFVFGRAMSKRILIPIQELVRVTEEVAQGNYKVTAIKYHNDEIGQLVDAVNIMTKEITRADQALGDLTDALRECEEPTIVVFFGDHRPNLFMTDGDTVYTKLGLCPDNDTVGWTPEEISDLYSTDYLIWANDAALLQGQAGTRRDSSITAIGPQLLELTGQPVTRYWALLEKVSQVCLTNTELYFVDGTGTPSAGVEEAALSDEARELLQLREDVLYDAMYGQQYITAEMNEPVQ